MLLARQKLLIAVPLLCTSLICGPAQTQSLPVQSEPPLVKLNVIVTDRAGHAVDGARKEDFQLFDDGFLETISYFSKEDPLVYGLVIDGSGSLKIQFREVVEVAKQVIAANKP